MPNGPELELEGTQFSRLSEAIRARMSPGQFDRMLKQRLNKVRWNITLADSYDAIVHDVIDEANRRGWVYRLVNAAREEVPVEAIFVEYAQMLAIAPEGLPDRGGLESIIDKTKALLDIDVFLSKAGRIMGQVCRVDLDGGGRGTGFLVGPNTVITNYHVIEAVAKAQKPTEALSCRFDFKVHPDGASINEGVDVPVAKLVAWSPYDPVDLKDQGGVPDPGNLDYAILELAGEPGNAPVGGAKDGNPRRWIGLPSAPPAFKKGDPLFIVQHPQKRPMKLALDTDAIIGVQGEGRRVRYSTNTEKGSSGSPCFDQNWNLVALHHSGDEAWVPTWNEGIPIDLVIAHAESQGVSLGKTPLPDDD